MADERIIYKCVYQHFKGGRYQVLEFAENTETGEKMVVYKALYAGNRNRVYVRSYKSFASETEVPLRAGQPHRAFDWMPLQRVSI